MGKDGVVGRWAFILGLILAVIVGLFNIPYSSFVLVILGLVVGFLNIQEKETLNYLVAVIALISVGIAYSQVTSLLNAPLQSWVQSVLANFVAFVAASGLVVAIKTVLMAGKD